MRENENEENYRFFCDKCKYGTNIKNCYERHCKSTLHRTGKRKKRSDLKAPNGYQCDICDFHSNNRKNYLLHKLNYHSDKDERKHRFNYYCEACDFGVFSKAAYKIHLGTKKHLRKNANN